MEEIKRKGDKVKIAGSYQYDAVHSGNTFQRNWHMLKLQTAVTMAALKEKENMLDVGCGSGILVSFLPKKNNSYLGLDANEDAIDFAKKMYANNSTFFQLFQVDDLFKMQIQTFSRIFFLETIEHITYEQGIKTLQHFYGLLQPGGLCIISTPNRKSMWPAIEWLLDFFRLTPRLKNEQHEKLYSVKELKEIAYRSGFIINDLKTINGLAPWFSFFGKKITQIIHDWEMRNNWFAGSLIVIALQKK